MDDVSIRAVRYVFAGQSLSVAELAARGRLGSAPSLLEDFGFSNVRVATTESPYSLVCAASRELLAAEDVDPESVGILLWAGAGAPVAFDVRPSAAESTSSHRGLARFRFPGPRLQAHLGLTGAGVIAVEQMGCNGLFAAVRIARALVLAGETDRALCVSAEFFPADASREAVFNCTSDAVVAVLVERGGASNRIIGQAQVTRGFHWDPCVGEEELLAGYFPTAQRVVRDILTRVGWTADDLDWVIPHNVSLRSWEILAGLLGIPLDKVWTGNIARYGHTIAGDNFINLHDAWQEGDVGPGQKLILFSFAYGAHWNALAVEA